MDLRVENQMIGLWWSTIEQCRKTVAFIDATDIRICVNSIDITDAERAAAIERIEYLEKLIGAVNVERHLKVAAGAEHICTCHAGNDDHQTPDGPSL